MRNKSRVLIVGGGFGGLAAAKRLARAPVEITLVDRTNHHLFQPLLYQVATGGLSPANLAGPLRSLFRRQSNVTVVRDEITQVDLDASVAKSAHVDYPFDLAVFATGGRVAYHGHDDWQPSAPGLKTLLDAIQVRSRVLGALEEAETAGTSAKLPSFVIAGGGPTGVELAGAIAELTRYTLRGEFRRVDPSACPILVIEPAANLLSSYPPKLSAKAAERLHEMGVEVRYHTMLVDVRDGTAQLRCQQRDECIDGAVVIWAAGIAAGPLAASLCAAAGIAPKHGGRVPVEPDLSLPGHPHCFAIGDMCYLEQPAGFALPGVAPVAIQQGRSAADNIKRCLAGDATREFRYRDMGSMAVIGRGAAVAHLGRLQLSGYPAWLAWLFVHLLQIVGYENRVLVAIQWAWNYFTRNRSARLYWGDRDAEELEATGASE